MADVFYPISIVEKDAILEQCQKIGIDGICTIASDLAAVTVNYVAEAMGLTGNGMRCCESPPTNTKCGNLCRRRRPVAPFRFGGAGYQS